MTQADSQLQDYLDGRLSPEQRQAFEARVRTESDLALQVESAREVRRVLQAEAPALSPGFYTRARARFEQEQRGPARRVWRVLSWESAGLAAAVGLAAVLFLPHLMREDVVLQETGLDSAPVVVEVSAPSEMPALPVEEAEKDEVGADRLDAPKKAKRQEARGKGDFAPVPPAPRPATQPAPQEAVEGLRRGRADAGLEGTGEKALADRVETEKGRVVAEKAAVAEHEALLQASEPAAPPDAWNESAPRARKQAAATYATMADADAEAEPNAGEWNGRKIIALPPEFKHQRELRVVEDEQAWGQLFQSPGGTALLRLGPSDTERLVLVGPRSPALDCDRLTVVHVDGRHEIRVPPGRPDLARGGGCALLVPLDGDPVRLALGALR